MESKRFRDPEDHQNNDDNNLQTVAKRRCRETLNLSLPTVLEPVLRKVLEEMIPPMLQRYVSPCCRLCHNHEGGSSGGRALQLCFVDELPQIIFTMDKVTAEGGGSLQIELRYAASQKRVETEEFSTLKAQIYVLDGDFENQEWTAEEFDGKIVKPRDGKGSLLRGETVIKIEKGVGFINNKKLKITDNSCSTRSKMFRLGVKIVGSSPLGAGISEAISEPFRVKDKRGAATRKSERPSLNDEVWRLKHIGKAGELRKQLSRNGIKTVKDLLRSNTTGSLREKFSKTNTWDKIIEHAKDCEVDDKERYLYTFHLVEQDISVSLVFNCIYELVEVMFNEQHRSLQSLNSEEKCLVGRVKLEAYSNLENLKLIETPTRDIVTELTGTEVASWSAPYQGLQLPTYQEQLETWTCTSPIIHDPWTLFAESYEWEQPNFVSFERGDEDGASYSQDNHSFLLNTAGYMSSKGQSKTVWQKVRNALKSVLQYG